MIELRLYEPNDKQIWDNLIANSKNGTFLFYRDYMDYHSDRFQDFSYLIFRKGKLEAVLPGNIREGILYSHQGLTYGGLIFTSKLTTTDVIEIFRLLKEDMFKNNISKVIYKPIPFIYHKQAAQEDIYALFLNNAVKIGCNISSTIDYNNPLKIIESRKSGIRKAENSGVKIFESNDFEAFWIILNNNLGSKYGKAAVHTVDEIKYLHSKFPNNIKLYLAKNDLENLAGVVVYVMGNVIHTQYISASEIGKQNGALDLLLYDLIYRKYSNSKYFDFGQSTENGGAYLNENLIFQKEGFGGRGVVYEIYQLDI